MKFCLLVCTLFLAPYLFANSDSLRDNVAESEVLELRFRDFDDLILQHFKTLRNFVNDSLSFDFNELDANPQYREEDFIARLKKLDELSPFELIYNEASKTLIDFYANRRTKSISKMLAQAELYFPIFEEALIRENMPLELKYLPIVESALNATARSRSGAEGLWQFMPITGKQYGLSISSYIDERLDPYQSTAAACNYLKKLHDIFGDWNLALAAYNAGPGTVNKAIHRSGGKTTYWEIRKFLPKETQSYVPAFIAVNYIMNYASYHNIYPVKPDYYYADMDSIHVHNRIKFDEIQRWIGLEEGVISFLNPKFKRNIIPAPDSTDVLVLPRSMVSAFICYQDSIYKYSSLDQHYASKTRTESKREVIHVVKKGETLSDIAVQHGCSVQELKTWNNKTGTYLAIGQKLSVFKPDNVKSTAEKTSEVNSQEIKNEGSSEPKSGVFYWYTIKKGDTLWQIAKNTPGVSVSDIQKWNPALGPNNLKTGAKIKIMK